MAATLTSKRYAQAVFEIAKEQDRLEEWRTDLKKISELTGQAEVLFFLSNPKVPFEDKAKLVRETLKADTSPLAINLAYLLISKGKIGNAKQITSEYEHLVDAYHGIKHAQITTAVSVDDSTKKMLTERLEALIGKRISINVKVDPDVLGGFVARIEDRLIDFSLRNKLKLLKAELVETKR